MIVTGIIDSGTVKVGDNLILAPSGIQVSVKGIKVYEKNVKEAFAG